MAPVIYVLSPRQCKIMRHGEHVIISDLS